LQRTSPTALPHRNYVTIRVAGHANADPLADVCNMPNDCWQKPLKFAERELHQYAEYVRTADLIVGSWFRRSHLDVYDESTGASVCEFEKALNLLLLCSLRRRGLDREAAPNST
jgi:hypothetical protein